jgi:hypothetical protein
MLAGEGDVARFEEQEAKFGFELGLERLELNASGLGEERTVK